MKTAIVTGGANGLGLNIALSLLSDNYKVAIIDQDGSALNALEQQYPELKLVAADLTCDNEVAIAIEKVIEQFERIDILINNAGLIHNEPLINILDPASRRHRYDTWKRVLSINLDTLFLTTSYVAEHMLMKRIKGVIINISSISAAGNAGQSAYSAAKAGVEALTVTWAKELGPMGVRCVAIAPGFIETPSTHRALPQSTIDHWKKQTALKKLGNPEQISETVKFIINNSYLTGEVIAIGGGLTL